MKWMIQRVAMSFLMAAVAFAILGTPKANSAGDTGDLLRQCENFQGGFCLGYIIGFYDGRTTKDYGLPTLQACFPTSKDGLTLAVSYEQMVLVIIKWAKDHPELHHWEQWQGVRQAFADAFSCKK